MLEAAGLHGAEALVEERLCALVVGGAGRAGTSTENTAVARAKPTNHAIARRPSGR